MFTSCVNALDIEKQIGIDIFGVNAIWCRGGSWDRFGVNAPDGEEGYSLLFWRFVILKARYSEGSLFRRFKYSEGLLFWRSVIPEVR